MSNDCNTLFSYNHLNITLDSFDKDNYIMKCPYHYIIIK